MQDNSQSAKKRQALGIAFFGLIFIIVGQFIPKQTCIADRFSSCSQEALPGQTHVSNLGLYLSIFGVILLLAGIIQFLFLLKRKQ